MVHSYICSSIIEKKKKPQKDYVHRSSTVLHACVIESSQLENKQQHTTKGDRKKLNPNGIEQYRRQI